MTKLNFLSHRNKVIELSRTILPCRNKASNLFPSSYVVMYHTWHLFIFSYQLVFFKFNLFLKPIVLQSSEFQRNYIMLSKLRIEQVNPYFNFILTVN